MGGQQKNFISDIVFFQHQDGMRKNVRRHFLQCTFIWLLCAYKILTRKSNMYIESCLVSNVCMDHVYFTHRWELCTHKNSHFSSSWTILILLRPFVLKKLSEAVQPTCQISIWVRCKPKWNSQICETGIFKTWYVASWRNTYVNYVSIVKPAICSRKIEPKSREQSPIALVRIGLVPLTFWLSYWLVEGQWPIVVPFMLQHSLSPKS